MNTFGRTYGSVKEINKHARIIITSNAREARFSIWFLQMFHHNFASVAQILCCGNLIHTSWRT